MKLNIPLLSLYLACPILSAVAADEPDIVIPAPTPVVIPTPMPDPSVPLDLDKTAYLVVPAKSPYHIRVNKPGVVTYTVESGKFKIRGRFADQPKAGVVSRTFDAPYLYVFEAASEGTAEVTFTPKGKAIDSPDAIKYLLLRTTAAPPDCPPAPVDPVKPDPDKPDPITAGPVTVYVVEESTLRTAADAVVIADQAMWKRVLAQTAGNQFKILDKDDPLVAKAGLGAAVTKTGIPCVVCVDKAGNYIAQALRGNPSATPPVPAMTAADLEALVKRASGIK